MPAEHRLTKATFPSRFSRRRAGKLLSIAVSNNGLRKPKFSCVVSKKTAPRAVDRNALKRRCREAFRPLLEKAAPQSIVAYPRREALGASFESLSQEAKTLLQQTTADLSRG